MKISKISLCISALALGSALTIQAQDSAEQAAARKALLEALGNPPAATAPAAPAAPATVAPPTAPAPAPAPAAPPVVQTPAPAEAPAPVAAQPGDNEAQAKARAALAQQMGTASSAPVTTAAPAKSSAAQPVVNTAPVLSSKEQKLQALLARYKADQITPQQYHEQRAAVLAEP